MKKQNNKRMKMISTLVTFGLGLTLGSVSHASKPTFTGNKEIVTIDRLEDSKPIAGRNRRRTKSTISISSYPKANSDKVRASRQLSKLPINVLLNDLGHKLRIVKINSRSAGGARVSVRNGMAIYQIPQHFIGKDSFWYTMQDKSGRQNSAKVIVCICDK